MKVIVIIPARSGSKSLPNKNILPLKGKPLLCYSISYGLESDIVDKVIVSTDSEEFAEIAKTYGADVPFIRPAELAMDNTRDYPFMRHALDYFESIGEIYDIYILLRPTSPLRPEGLIEKSISILKENPTATSVRAVAQTKEHPYRVLGLNKDGSIDTFISNIEEPYNHPRQELPEVYSMTGDIEAARRETLLSGSVSGKKIFPLIINPEDKIDIDHIDDFRKAEKRLGN
ncbi:MAG: acylneuraminate cytidylyltransferase family protein [Cellvibrionales bacterium]|nr:acylneuraminate cytidylyltransferase family protein [Cellvibrionales bacterium]